MRTLNHILQKLKFQRALMVVTFTCQNKCTWPTRITEQGEKIHKPTNKTKPLQNPTQSKTNKPNQLGQEEKNV